MARHLHPAVEQGRYGRPEEARETISSDGERYGSTVDLHAPYLGAPPEVLLELALDALYEREKDVADLLRLVPRKYEDEIKALDAPMYEARRAIAAVAILIENSRDALAPPDMKAD